MGNYKWSRRSMGHINEVHPKLRKVALEVIKITPHDLMITDGKRTTAEQRALVKKGASKTMKSNHLTGRALDFVPLLNGKPAWVPALYREVWPAWKAAADKVGVKIRWGGHWRRFVDMPHIELDKSER